MQASLFGLWIQPKRNKVVGHCVGERLENSAPPHAGGACRNLLLSDKSSDCPFCPTEEKRQAIYTLLYDFQKYDPR